MQIEREREEDRISGRERRFSTARGHVSLSPRPFLLSVCSFDRARSSASLSPRRPTPLDSLPFFLSPSFPPLFLFSSRCSFGTSSPLLRSTETNGGELLLPISRPLQWLKFGDLLLGGKRSWIFTIDWKLSAWCPVECVSPARMRYQERLEERLIKFSPSRNFSFLRSCPRHFFGGEKYWRDFGQSCSRSPISRFFQRFFPFDSPFKGGTVL